MNIGERLANIRKYQGYKQKEVATHLHISTSSLSNYERSVHEPPYDVLVQLCDFYCVSADYILGRTNCMMGVEKLNQKLIYGYTLGDCMELILQSDKAHQEHMLKYFELTQPHFQRKNKK